MARKVGDTFRCDQCAAEITYTRACTCLETDLTEHAEICCGKEMRAVTTKADTSARKREPEPA